MRVNKVCCTMRVLDAKQSRVKYFKIGNRSTFIKTILVYTLNY